MQKIALSLLFLLLCTACGQTIPSVSEEPPRQVESGSEEESPATPEAEDYPLLTLDAPLADGRNLRLEALGKKLDESSYGVREVRVYEGEILLQTILVREATEEVWDYGSGTLREDFYDYTECWTPEETMEVLDLNFDGNTDFGLFGWSPNNTIPYYYWLWDAQAEQFHYAFTLQGVEVHSETKEISASYKDGSAGSYYITEYYRPGQDGALYLDRVERLNGEISGSADRAAQETWVPPEHGDPIRPGEPNFQLERDLLLVRRELPAVEVHGDGTVSHFTEIWERKDGELQMTGREEFFYE